MLAMVQTLNDSSYWEAVAQIIPVLAIALVIEARRSVTHWTVEKKWQRRVESVTHSANAFLLLTTFIGTLTTLATQKERLSADLTTYLLVASLFFLVINPVYLVMVRANVDLILVSAHLVHFLLGAKARNELARMSAELDEAEDKIAPIMPQSEVLISMAREEVKDLGLFATTATEWRNSYLGEPPYTQFPRQVGIEKVNDLVEQYDKAPSADLASRLRKIKLWQLTYTRAHTQEQLHEIQLLRAEITSMRHSTLRTLERHELLYLRKNIEKAGEDFLVLWPIAPTR
jgi:hypothetical protein